MITNKQVFATVVLGLISLVAVLVFGVSMIQSKYPHAHLPTLVLCGEIGFGVMCSLWYYESYPWRTLSMCGGFVGLSVITISLITDPEVKNQVSLTLEPYLWITLLVILVNSFIVLIISQLQKVINRKTVWRFIAALLYLLTVVPSAYFFEKLASVSSSNEMAAFFAGPLVLLVVTLLLPVWDQSEKVTI